jgi:predicted metal-dependent hydrolase
MEMITVQDFKSEVTKWADDIEVMPKEIHLRSMSRKWASCSSKGRLTFSSALLNEPDDVRAKVIVHELLHLKYPTHGKMFKTLFVSYLRKKGIICSLNNLKIHGVKTRVKV